MTASSASSAASAPAPTPAPATVAAPAPSPAVAPPPGSPRFPLFEGLRAVAVVGVLLFHVAELTGALAKPVTGDAILAFGPVAVATFFVISGFLLYRPYVAARAAGRPIPSTRRYFRRRFLRILPGYWFALTALAIFPGIVGVFTSDWWRYYFFFQLYSPYTVGKGIPVAWTLCVEMTFYLCLPLWAAAAARFAPRARFRADLVAIGLIALLGAAVQLLAARREVSELLASSIAGQVTWLAIGMALAVASVASLHRGRVPAALQALADRPGLCWAGAAAATGGLIAIVPSGGLLGLVAALSRPQPVAETLARIALTGAACGLLAFPAVFGSVRRGIPRRLMGWGPVMWLGVMGYGLYLWHITIAQLLALPSDPQHYSAPVGLGLATRLHVAATPVLFVLTLGVSSALALASYRFVELPFLRRKERRTRRGPAAAS